MTLSSLLNEKQIKVNFIYERKPFFIRKKSNKELKKFLEDLNSKDNFLIDVESDNFDLFKINQNLNNEIKRTDDLFKLFFIKYKNNKIILKYSSLKDSDLKNKFRNFSFEYPHLNNDEAEKRMFAFEVEIYNKNKIVVEKIIFSPCIFSHIEENLDSFTTHINCSELINYYILPDLWKLKTFN